MDLLGQSKMGGQPLQFFSVRMCVFLWPYYLLMANLPPYLDELVRAHAVKELMRPRAPQSYCGVIWTLALAKEHGRRPVYRLIGCMRMNVSGKVANAPLPAHKGRMVCPSVDLLHGTEWCASVHRLERVVRQSLIDAGEKLSILVLALLPCGGIFMPNSGGVCPVTNLTPIVEDDDGNRNAEIHSVLIIRSNLTVNVVIDVSEVNDVRERVVHGRGIHSGGK